MHEAFSQLLFHANNVGKAPCYHAATALAHLAICAPHLKDALLLLDESFGTTSNPAWGALGKKVSGTCPLLQG